MSTEPWRWGDLFEVDVPIDIVSKDLGEMVELRFGGRDTPLLLAAFSPVPDDPETALRSGLKRFAATRGMPLLRARAGLELSRDPSGLVAGRITFLTDLHWMALAVAWSHGAVAGAKGGSCLVIAFAAASQDDDPIFDDAEALFATLHPLDQVVATGAHVAPEAPGEF